MGKCILTHLLQQPKDAHGRAYYTDHITPAERYSSQTQTSLLRSAVERTAGRMHANGTRYAGSRHYPLTVALIQVVGYLHDMNIAPQ